MDFIECGRQSRDSIVTAAENKRKFIINNSGKKHINKVSVDGCLIDDGRARCDYLFEIDRPFCLVIYLELKGSDVKKAFKQLESTINACKSRHGGVEMCCHIVASRVPKMGVKVQHLKMGFAKKHKTQVHISTSKCEIQV